MRATAHRMTQFDVFAESLYRECPRAAYELESMKYGLMARLGMGERDALELAVRIVAADPTSSAKLSRGKNEMYSDKQQRQTV